MCSILWVCQESLSRKLPDSTRATMLVEGAINQFNGDLGVFTFVGSESVTTHGQTPNDPGVEQDTCLFYKETKT
ncbi:hypothetical protein STEG23_016660, partial [Scotinomys teguina]